MTNGHPAYGIIRHGCSAVYRHASATVDIVLVHGLHGHPELTWTASNGIFWPGSLLPEAFDAENVHANVITYGYNADVYTVGNGQSASDNFIHQHAQTLVSSLTTHRRCEGTSHLPIIFVAHSLGGILVKRALLYSNDVKAAHHEEYRSVFISTYGIVFLGTPHCGADAASWALMLQGMADAVLPRKLLHSESVLLRTLKKDNETLANINNHFLDVYQRFHVHMVHENHKTDIKGTRITVVDAGSASPQLPGVTYYGMEASHATMCKFAGASAPGFRTMVADLQQWARDAPGLIAVRWRIEDADKRARAMVDILERAAPLIVSPSLIPSPGSASAPGAAASVFGLHTVPASQASASGIPRSCTLSAGTISPSFSVASTLGEEFVDSMLKLTM